MDGGGEARRARRVRRLCRTRCRQGRTPRGRAEPRGEAAARCHAAEHRGGAAQVVDKLGRHGRVLAVVDQPASIGALPVAVARACGHQVAYLPGLVMRRLADLHPGTAKTDLLTELRRGSSSSGRQVLIGASRFSGRGRRRGRGAGSVPVGGCSAWVVGAHRGSVRAVSAR